MARKPLPKDDDPLLSVGEIANLFNVNPITVQRWADRKLIASIKTPGGHRRIRRSEAMKFLNTPATSAPS